MGLTRPMQQGRIRSRIPGSGQPVNPTMAGRSGLMSQVAGQTGANQYNGGGMPGMAPRRRMPFNTGGIDVPQPQVGVMASNGQPQIAEKTNMVQGDAPPEKGTPSPIQTLDNSFMGGKLSSVNTMPDDIRGLRSNLVNYLNDPSRMMQQHEADYARTDIGNGERINGSYGSGIPNINRSMIRDVNAQGPGRVGLGRGRDVNFSGIPGQVNLDPNVAPKVNYNGLSEPTPQTQSLDQLGPGSQFFQNINNQLNPVFEQRRAQALAQAKESAGNLTGSGFANILGQQVNKSLAEENAMALDYATKAAMAEQQRQGASADRSQNRILTDAQYNLDAQKANQNVGSQYGLRGAELNTQRDIRGSELGLDASKANQSNTQSYDTTRASLQNSRDINAQNNTLSASRFNQQSDSDFINNLLNRGGLSLQSDELGLRRDIANQDNTRSMSQFQGNLDAQRLANIYGTRTGVNTNNANRFSDNLGRLSTTGVGPNELVSSGGAGSLLGPLGELLGSRGGGIGNGTGTGLLGGLLNGGGRDKSGNFGALGDLLGKYSRAMGGLSGIRNQALKGGAAYGVGELASNVLGKNTMAGKVASAAGKGAAIGSVIPGVGTLIGGGIGAAVPIAQKAGSWLKKRLSDERLKENITSLGHGLYEYNFKGSSSREVGFLAQEVKKALPSAVSRHKSGYLQVDYSKTPSIINALHKVS